MRARPAMAAGTTAPPSPPITFHGDTTEMALEPSAPRPDDADQVRVGAGPRPPWWQRVGAKDVLCVGPLILFGVLNFATRFLTPLLLSNHPVLLEFIRGTTPSMIVAGAKAHAGQASLPLVILAPLPVLLVADPFLYWAGVRYGRRIINWLIANDPRWRKRADRGERIFAKYGPWTIAFSYVPGMPTLFCYLAAGEVRMPLLIFATADVAGTLMWVGLNVWGGWVAGDRALAVADTISHYAIWVTIGLVLLAVAGSVWRSVREPGPAVH